MSDEKYDTIYKYPLRSPVNVLDIPADATVIAVATQHGQPTIWVRLDPTAPTVQRTLIGTPTGGYVQHDAVYLGTAHDVEGAGLVFHIFERASGVSS